MAAKSTIFVEGFLIKRGHRRHNWKIRWFKLSDSSLRYYTDKKHNVPHGRISLINAHLTKSKDAGFKDRENVFIVTTSSGVQYPIQASTQAEYKIWIDAVQQVIDMNSDKTGSRTLPLQSGIITSDLDSNDHRKSQVFADVVKSQNGAQMHSKMLYNEIISGLELRRWTEKTMGISREAAEETIKSLVQVGFVECLTSDQLDFSLFDNSHYFRLLADEASLQAMSSSYLKKLKITQSESAAAENDTNNNKGTALRRLKKSSPHGPGLPGDLPPGDVIKRGILFKRGHIVPSWKARCFVLQEFPATLSYFDPAKKTLKTINSLKLPGASVFPLTKSMAETSLKISNPPEHLFCVKVATGDLYPITAASEKEKVEWMDAISSMCRKIKES